MSASRSGDLCFGAAKQTVDAKTNLCGIASLLRWPQAPLAALLVLIHPHTGTVTSESHLAVLLVASGKLKSVSARDIGKSTDLDASILLVVVFEFDHGETVAGHFTFFHGGVLEFGGNYLNSFAVFVRHGESRLAVVSNGTAIGPVDLGVGTVVVALSM